VREIAGQFPAACCGDAVAVAEPAANVVGSSLKWMTTLHRPLPQAAQAVVVPVSFQEEVDTDIVVAAGDMTFAAAGAVEEMMRNTKKVRSAYLKTRPSAPFFFPLFPLIWLLI
jgi:hypothetical protein